MVKKKKKEQVPIMGLITKIVVIVAIALVSIWAYENVKIGSTNICITDIANELDITCLTSIECDNYLMSTYGAYPNTPESAFILSQTTSCNEGKCSIKEFSKKNVCATGEIPLTFKITVKDWAKRTILK